MKTSLTFLLLIAGLVSYGQKFEIIINQPIKSVTIPRLDYDPDHDTVVVFNSMNQMAPYFTLDELKDKLVIKMKNVGAKPVGEYNIAVLEGVTRKVVRQYPLKVRTPKPEIKAVYCKEQGKRQKGNVFEVKWDNSSDNLTLVIEGRNFYTEDPNSNATARIIDWIGGDPNIAMDVTDSYDSLLVFKLNLSRLTRTGDFDLRVVNFDNMQSKSVPISIVPVNPAAFHGTEGTGGIKSNEIPKLESIRWINKDDELDKLMKGSIYATGTEQEYFLEMNFEFNYQPSENDFTVFGVPLKNPMGGRKKYTYEVTLPANLAIGDEPKLTYAGKGIVPVKSGQGSERVLGFNKPAEMPGFITVFPDDRVSQKFDYYSNLGETRTVAYKAGKTKLKIRVHNYKSWHMGNQNLTIVCTLRTMHGATKVSNSEKQVKNDAIQEKAVVLAEGDSTEISVDFNTLRISPWNMVDIAVVYNKKTYTVPYLLNDPGKVLTIQYTSNAKTKFTYGVGIPTSAMAVYEFNKKDWLWSPFTLGLDFGFDWIDEFGASKGRGLGIEFGFFQFINMGNNTTKSFAFSAIPFFKQVFGYKKKGDIIVPFQVGAGVVPEWRHGVSYLHLAVMFQLRFDGMANRVSR